MSASVHETVSGIIASFERGDIPEAIAYSMFPIPNLPSSKWSLLNRTIMFLAGTQDARGFRQWKQAGRHVKKGAKSFRILVPCIVKKENGENGEVEHALRGFMCKPVFRVEDTDGEALEYETLELPDFPLMERAEEWGISVKAIPGNYRYYGYYQPGRKEIALATAGGDRLFPRTGPCCPREGQGGTESRTRPITGDRGGTLGPSIVQDGRQAGKRHYRQQLQVHPELRRETQAQPPSRLPEGDV